MSVVCCDIKFSNNEEIQKCIESLKDLVMRHEKLKNFRTDDSYMLRFLHCHEFQVEEAFNRIVSYCNLYLEYPDWFASAPPLNSKTQIERNSKTIMNGRDFAGRSIFVVKLCNVDPYESCLMDEMIVDDLWLESVLDDPQTQENGVCVLVDVSNYSIKLLTWIKPLNLKIGISKLELYPVKEFIIHVVNTSTMLQFAKKIVWPLVPTRFKNNVHFHLKNWKSLHQHISSEILPSEYGGTGPKLDFSERCQWLFKQNDKFQEKLCYHKLK